MKESAKSFSFDNFIASCETCLNLLINCFGFPINLLPTQSFVDIWFNEILELSCIE